MPTLSGPPSASAVWPITLFLAYISLVLFLTSKALVNIIPVARRTLSALSTIPTAKRRAFFFALTFLLLIAGSSFTTTCRALAGHAELSYRAWAVRYGVPSERTFWIEVQSCFMRRFSEQERWADGGAYLGLWLRDGDLWREAWACVARGHARTWWTIVWCLCGFVTIWDWSVRGPKHGVQGLWSIAALIQLVSVSFGLALILVQVLLNSVSGQYSAIRSTDEIDDDIPLTPIKTSLLPPPPTPRRPLLDYLRILLILAVYALAALFVFRNSNSTFYLPLVLCIRASAILIPFLTRNMPSVNLDHRRFTSSKIRLMILAGALLVVAIPPRADVMSFASLFREMRARPAFAAVGWDLMLLGLLHAAWDLWDWKVEGA